MDERVFGLMEAAEWHQKAAEKATQALEVQIEKLEKILEKLSLALNGLPQDFTQAEQAWEAHKAKCRAWYHGLSEADKERIYREPQRRKLKSKGKATDGQRDERR